MTVSLLPHYTPDSIEAASFAIIDAEAGPERRFKGRAWEIARRLVHTTADFSILENLVLEEAAIDAGIRAICRSAHIYTDTEMARSGIVARHFSPLKMNTQCLLSLPGVAERAMVKGSTRSCAAVQVAGERLGDSIVAFGNAPTALLALIDSMKAGGAVPALVIAMPVGFVNAAESKALLLECCEQMGSRAPACITLQGRKGGSPLAAATVNALARLAARQQAASKDGHAPSEGA